MNFSKKIKIDFNLLLILREEILLLKKNLGKNFCEFFFEILKNHFYDINKIKNKIDKIENAFYEFFILNENNNEDFFLEQYFDIIEENLINNKSDFYDINFDFEKMIKNLKSQFSYFLGKLTRLKKNFDFKIFNSNYNDFKIFYDIFEKKMKKLLQMNKIYKNSDEKLKLKISFLKKENLKNKNFLEEKKNFNQKLSLLVEKLENENKNLKNITKNLFQKNKNLKEKIQTDFSKISILISFLNEKKNFENKKNIFKSSKNLEKLLKIEKDNFIMKKNICSEKNLNLNENNFDFLEKEKFFEKKKNLEIEKKKFLKSKKKF